MPKKHSYYHINQKPRLKGAKSRIFFALLTGFVLLVGGLYFGVLTYSPEVIAEPTDIIKSREQQLVSDDQNFIKVEKLSLLAPIITKANQIEKESSVWWQSKEQANPKNGGNFILCGHKLKIGITPNQTKRASPLYHLDKLEKDDKIEVYFESQWYSYRVTDKRSSTQGKINTDESAQEAILTLYTCTTNGDADGVIITANLITGVNSVNNENENASNLLQ